jgi:hypothetical protein
VNVWFEFQDPKPDAQVLKGHFAQDRNIICLPPEIVVELPRK